MCIRDRIEILDSTDAKQVSQDKAVELIEQALAGLDGISEEGKDAMAEVGRWAAEGGR